MAAKTPAPALARGLACLQTLGTGESFALEELARRTGIPKASLLRLLETLGALGLVVRDDADKRYRALATIVPVAHARAAARELIREALRRLATATGTTAEWYVHQGADMVIVDREQPRDKIVQVRATLGFRRLLDGELEAVARVAIAAGVAAPRTDHWSYRDGIPTTLAAAEAAALLAEAAGGIVRDLEYNLNGVRRYAAIVRLADGTLTGVLALAENFTPDAEREAASRLATLAAHARELAEHLGRIA